MIRRARAVWARVAVDGVAAVALVRVRLEVALGQLEVVLGHDLVEREGAAGL